MRVSRIIVTASGCFVFGCASSAPPPSANPHAEPSKMDPAAHDRDMVQPGLVDVPAVAAAEASAETPSEPEPVAPIPTQPTSAAPVEGALAIPRDWQRVEVDALSIPMPLGVEQRRDGARLELVAREGSAKYSVRLLALPAQPLTQNNVTAATLNVLGGCTSGLRVSGVVERPGFFSSVFTARCPSGLERQGRLIVTGDDLVVLSVEAPRDSGAIVDPFLYGFEATR